MENGKIHIPDPVKESMASCDVMGIVVALGGDCWNGPNETPRAEPGDQVLVTRYAGGVIKGDDGYVYKLVPDHSIYAVKEKADG